MFLVVFDAWEPVLARVINCRQSTAKVARQMCGIEMFVQRSAIACMEEHLRMVENGVCN